MKKFIALLGAFCYLLTGAVAYAQDEQMMIHDIAKAVQALQLLRPSMQLGDALNVLIPKSAAPDSVSYTFFSHPTNVSRINEDWRVRSCVVTLLYGDACTLDLLLRMPDEQYDKRREQPQHELWQIMPLERAPMLQMIAFDENGFHDAIEKFRASLDESNCFGSSVERNYIMVKYDGLMAGNEFMWLDETALLHLEGWDELYLEKDCELNLWQDDALLINLSVDLDAQRESQNRTSLRTLFESVYIDPDQVDSVMPNSEIPQMWITID